MTFIRKTAIADCPFSAAIDYAAEYFGQHTTLPLVGTVALQTNVLTTFEIVLDPTDKGRVHKALHLNWSPGERLPLPRFAGLLTVRPSSGLTKLILEGTYEAPFGIAGALFDRLVGKQIAGGTVNRLLRQIAVAIETRWREYASEKPDIATLNARAGT